MTDAQAKPIHDGQTVHVIRDGEPGKLELVSGRFHAGPGRSLVHHVAIVGDTIQMERVTPCNTFTDAEAARTELAVRQSELDRYHARCEGRPR